MSKHTPGPWIASHYGFIIRDINDEDSLDDTRIACIEEDKEIPDKERWANANLIASAPELLIACKLALNNMLKQGLNDGYPDTVQALKQAISKAEGK